VVWKNSCWSPPWQVLTGVPGEGVALFCQHADLPEGVRHIDLIPEVFHSLLVSLNWSTLRCWWVPPLFGAMPMRVTVFIFNGQVFFKKYVVVPPRGLWLAYPLRCRGYWIKYQWTTLSRSSHGSTGQVSRSRTDSELLFQSSPYQTQLRSWKSRGSARLGEGDQRNYFFIMINVLEYLYGRMVPGHG
jgi:hypothetical protein